MAAERKPAASARHKRVEKAFQRLVELVEPIEDAQYVLGFPDDAEPEFFTYITERNEAVMHELFRREYEITDEFPDLDLHFHTRYLEGRPLNSFSRQAPPLLYWLLAWTVHVEHRIVVCLGNRRDAHCSIRIQRCAVSKPRRIWQF